MYVKIVTLLMVTKHLNQIPITASKEYFFIFHSEYIIDRPWVLPLTPH